jgi:hypothetical protein
VNDNTAVAWVERLQGDVQDLNKQHSVDVRIASGGGRMAVTMDRYEVCTAVWVYRREGTWAGATVQRCIRAEQIGMHVSPLLFHFGRPAAAQSEHLQLPKSSQCLLFPATCVAAV